MRIRKSKTIALFLVTVLMVSSLCGCGGKKEEEEEKVYEVRFELNGGSRVSGSLHQEVEEGKSAKEPEVEREGYFFDGWDKDFSGIEKDTVVKAKWIKAVNVTFDANGGEITRGESTVVIASGKKPQAPSVSREGFIFKGWDREVGEATEDTTYVAQWERAVPTAEEVYQSLAVSMVEIRTYDAYGDPIGLGSGFFIDTNGKLLTNFHVMEGASTAEIYLYDEENARTYHATEIEGYDKDIDLCVVQTDVRNTTPVTLFTGNVKTGETIYTLGSSKGLTGTFSDGIVSKASRLSDGVECIQITAPISPGNSGGPLVNEYGEVLGVNTFQYVEGQNLNFAVSIKELDNIDRSETITIAQFGALTGDSVKPSVTIVETGDEGEYVYSMTNDIELEPNDTIDDSDPLTDGYWKAAYLADGEVDMFYFYIPEPATITVYLLSYWTDDDQYLYAYLRDDYGDVLPDSATGRSAYIGMDDYDEEESCKIATFRIPEAGYYILDTHIPNDYPFANGCYYLVGYETN